LRITSSHIRYQQYITVSLLSSSSGHGYRSISNALVPGLLHV